MSKAFWVEFKAVDGLSVEENNDVIDGFQEVVHGRKCSGDGGTLRPWTWKELVHVSDEKKEITEKDRKAVIDHLESDGRVTVYVVGELVEWDDEYAASMDVVRESLKEHLRSMYEVN